MINHFPLLIIFGWLLFILFFSYLCRKVFPEEKELSRKIVHIGTGPIIPLAWWFKFSSNLVLPLALLITCALIINQQKKIIPSIENIERKSFGTIAYGISISFLIALFWSTDPSAVTAGVLVMSFGDGLAGLIGSKIQSPYWIVFGQKKSLLGTSIMGFTTTLVLLALSHTSNLPLHLVDVLSLTTIAIILEQISPLGIDNITVPIVVGMSWHWLLLN